MKQTNNLIVKLSFYFFMSIFFLASCDKDNVVPGAVVSENRGVENFSEIEIGYDFDVIMTIGEEESLIIEAPKGYQPYIHSTVTKNKLVVEIDRHVRSSRIKTKRIYLTVKSVNKIILSGSTALQCDDLISGTNFELDASGASEASLFLETEEVNLSLSGASRANIAGSTDILSLQQISGASTVFGFDLFANEVTVSASGASKIYVNASEKLLVNASGASIVHFKGNPVVQSNLSGGSQVINDN